MSRSVVIDCLPESALQYGSGYAVVAIDVIRATTTAITAAALGRRVYPVPSIEAALPVAAVLHRPLLAGELGGNMPYGFDITNSPAQVAERRDVRRPMILLSSSGTQLIHNAAGADALYLASLRNLSATVRHLVRRHERVAVIGAGTRGEFREEDQACCAWIAAAMVDAGFEAANAFTTGIIDRWRDIPQAGWLGSKSVEYLRRSDQLRDLDFILAHIDDLSRVFAVRDGEVVDAASGRPPRRISLPAIADPRALVEHE
jgi:2-phosphosulfolactate phosphatase